MDKAELEDMGIPGSPGCFKPCPTCDREWYYTHGDLMSKPRKVRLVAPITEGVQLDDCIKPVKVND
jgi:hypothetical protein